jgi:L-ascorbate metabolism protein UlaG (beta-lactamase superfamily)
MKIKYLGHACFLVSSSEEVRIILDPYEPGGYDGAIAYGPIRDTADIVVVTHDHADHSAVSSVPGNPLTVRGPAVARGIDFDFVEADHDASGGQKRGKVNIALFSVDGYRVCHLSDLGQRLTEAQIDSIGAVDVAFVPVGGTYTLDGEGACEVIKQIGASLAIPMHYKTPQIGFSLASVDDFLGLCPNARRPGRSEIEIAPNALPSSPQVIALEPAA